MSETVTVKILNHKDLASFFDGVDSIKKDISDFESQMERKKHRELGLTHIHHSPSFRLIFETEEFKPLRMDAEMKLAEISLKINQLLKKI